MYLFSFVFPTDLPDKGKESVMVSKSPNNVTVVIQKQGTGTTAFEILLVWNLRHTGSHVFYS